LLTSYPQKILQKVVGTIESTPIFFKEFQWTQESNYRSSCVKYIQNNKWFRELGAEQRRKLFLIGFFYGHDAATGGAESYPHLIHAGFLLSAFVNLANRHI